MKKQKKIVLSISLLASDRKDTIRKCLESLKPLMEQLPCELIIVDTGCGEEVRRILEEYATRIVEFEWCRDFAKARNAGMKLAQGEWFLFIDDDEWFEDVTEIIKFFRSGNYKKYGYANYIVRNYLDKEGSNYSDTWASRMVRLQKDMCFKSRVHEYIDPVRGACTGIHSYVHHYGYVYADKQAEKEHFERNKNLLLEMLEEEPDNMRWWVQLAQEYCSVTMHQELLDLGRKALERFADVKGVHNVINLGTFYIAVISALLGFKRYEEALDACEDTFKDSRNTEMCRAFACLYKGQICIRLKRYEESEKSIQEYFRMYHALQKEQDKLFAQKSALLVNTAFDDLKIKKAYEILIYDGLKKNDTSYLKKYLKKLEWEKKYIYILDGLLEAVLEGIAAMPEQDIFVDAINVISKHAKLWNSMLIDLRAWELSGRAGFDKIIRVLARAEEDDVYLCSIKIRAMDMEKNYEGLADKYKQWLEKSENVFQLPEELWKIAKEQGLPVESYFLSVPAEKWRTHLRDYIAGVKQEELQQLKERLQPLREQENWRCGYFEMRVLEAEILFQKKWDDYHICRQKLEEFAERTVTFNRRYYKEEIIEQFPELLPGSFQASLWLQKALGQQQTDWETTKECLKQCAAVYHGMADAVKELIRLYGQEQMRQKREAGKAAEEMRMLAVKLKEKIRELLQGGMAQEAAGILEQLRQLLAEDLEVTTLSLQTKLQLAEMQAI